VTGDGGVAGELYGNLAPWWPLISPVEDYAEEAAFAAGLLRAEAGPVREVLELGSGGGHNAFYFKAHFEMTLVDLAPEMLAVSRRLNPECAHVVGDMRTVRLDRTFDAVFVHDAVMYMTTAADLLAAAETAFVHCRPGGVALFVPDETAETYEPYTDHGGTDDDLGRGVRYLEWTYDPDPHDTEVVSEYVFVLREPGRPLQIVHETHHEGMFGRGLWIAVLESVGFAVEPVEEVTTEDRRPRELFLARRPPDG
jgi:SAM-dependent methyltransferase